MIIIHIEASKQLFGFNLVQLHIPK